MTSRDLYAACSGMFAVLATQHLGMYLAEPRLGVAIALVALSILFVATMAAHVTVIVTERGIGRQPRRSQTARPRKRQSTRRPLKPVAQTISKVEAAA